MQPIPLKQFVSDKGQTEAARLLKMTQGALSKALRRNRLVFVTQQEGGVFKGREIKDFPCRSGEEGR